MRDDCALVWRLSHLFDDRSDFGIRWARDNEGILNEKRVHFGHVIHGISPIILPALPPRREFLVDVQQLEGTLERLTEERLARILRINQWGTTATQVINGSAALHIPVSFLNHRRDRNCIASLLAD